MKKLLLFTIICFAAKLYSQTQAHLDINNVKALILNRADMFWDPANGNAAYEVPKNSGKHTNFTNALWLGGFDSGGQLHTAGMTYRQNGFDFWPGPLDTLNATIDATTSAAFNKVWKVNASDISAFITAYNNGSVTANTFTPATSILTWPAHGNTAAGYANNLAPFVDIDGDGLYNPMGAGDYPLIKGDQMIYYIVNDKMQAHTETQGAPLGVEVHVSAYAYGCPSTTSSYPPLYNTTFYHYKIINRSSFTYFNMRTAIFSDADLGYYFNDYIGCDPSSNLGYIYNATPTDGAYGNYPPITSYQILKGPIADPLDGMDNNNNGIVDETGEDIRLSNFMFYNNNIGAFNPATTNPSLTLHYYNYMSNKWNDGSSLKADSSGYLSPSSTVQVTPYAYPGNPQTNIGWSEYTRNNAPGDRRFIIGNGPFTFNANEVIELEYSILTTFDSTAGGYKNIVKVKNENNTIKNFYALSVKPACSSVSGIHENELQEGILSIIPNPASESAIVNTNKEIKNGEIKVFNSLGQLIYSEKISGNSHQITVSDLPQGIYFAEVRGDNFHAMSKLIRN